MHTDAAHDGHADGHHDPNWFFRVLSFRAIVASLAFFGLSGLAAHAADLGRPVTLLIAFASGATAIAVVFWIMRAMQTLQAEGTIRIERAVGKIGTVYLRIPANEAESGKVQLNLQNRTVEYLAMTSGSELSTGTKVEVVGIISPTTVAVVPVTGPECL
jgi:membrane protein implicated in regulation of membrane protease activity